MDFEFSTEYEDFRKELRSFAENDMPEGFDPDEADKDEIQGIRQKIAKKGWLTLPWPEEYGGMGAPHLKQMVFNEETAYRRIPANDNAISMLGPILMLEGTDEQKQKFLPPIAKAEVRWAQGYSEPQSGSDLASLQTRAVEDGDDFVINGTKIWTSGAHEADWLFMLARTDPDAPKHRGISFLLVDMKAPGVEVRPIIDMAGRHNFNQLFFDNVRVPKQNLVGEYNRGWYVGARLLDFERSGVNRSASARRTLEEITDFAKNNTLNGKAMSSISRVKNNLANMAIEVEVSRMISYRIGYLQSKGEVFNKEASMGKMFGTEMVQRIYSAGMDMLGLYGTLQQGSKYAPLNGRIQKGYLASYSATIAAGTSEIQRNVVATRGLGLPRA
ncbi:MAG: acyl-CoA dehydrogenase [SAR202 cluster bacterium]|nr:acyl-CoA dehydrogenase [SAR202 cluster bacterium]|tara:strand:- start:3836 stop:4993 length:1158 start_codon:yes stop_codon:yes gene_type:complete